MTTERPESGALPLSNTCHVLLILLSYILILLSIILFGVRRSKARSWSAPEMKENKKGRGIQLYLRQAHQEGLIESRIYELESEDRNLKLNKCQIQMKFLE